MDEEIGVLPSWDEEAIEQQELREDAKRQEEIDREAEEVRRRGGTWGSMNNEIDHAYFRGQQCGESPKSICWHVDKLDRNFWVPKSLCEIRQNGQILEVEKWFADREGMTG